LWQNIFIPTDILLKPFVTNATDILSDLLDHVFDRAFKAPVFGRALSGMAGIPEKPSVKAALGLREAGSVMGMGGASAGQVKKEGCHGMHM